MGFQLSICQGEVGFGEKHREVSNHRGERAPG